MKDSLRARIVLYSIVSIGLGLIELFGSHFRKDVAWGSAFGRAGQKILMFLVLFAALELIYQLILWIRGKVK